jgi:hypothetical protein
MTCAGADRQHVCRGGGLREPRRSPNTHHAVMKQAVSWTAMVVALWRARESQRATAGRLSLEPRKPLPDPLGMSACP